MPDSRPIDAIAAVATPPGKGGVGIVRVSGRHLLGLASRLTGKPESAFPPRKAILANFCAEDGSVFDQGLVLYFPAPHSFTGEEVLELSGHGGPVVMQMLLARCCALGCRLAKPGEFSYRAFLNGKIDLAQAEAVADLIDAASQQAARSAMRSLSGEFSRAVHEIVERLIALRALIEASLDFPDEEIEAEELLAAIDARAQLAEIGAAIERLIRRARQGAVLRTGLHVVLAGLPNVGKSSLLNRLAGEERAIVTEIAGTTRDALRETITVEGIPLHIIDTAGLRETDDAVEKIGIERTWREIERADVVLQIVDARTGVTPADHAIAVRLPTSVERIVVENKCDLAGIAPARRERDGRVHLVLSAKTGAGVELLQAELLRVAGFTSHGEDAILARERHLAALARAAVCLARAADELARLELAAEELRLAQEALSEITGEYTSDDLLGEIFGRFCIGK
ncbi:MAG: tRNA uridine-5-carboxymethylaminomethyl(34) synthesis GTPase MnmE [Rhodocyclaceae bacterium]|nr:tRNA uridine-5-carboxymethylaminomethyl(34) synthesis GTPase MnmE [Rhodocyclaceae bacterium]